MKLKVICQLCGKVQEIDTEKPVGRQPRWEGYRLIDFGLEKLPIEYRDYEIWICGECHKKFLIYTGIFVDETDDLYPEYEWDWEKLEGLLRESLKLQKENTENLEDNIPENEINNNMLYTYTYMATSMGHLSPEEYYCPEVKDEEGVGE